METLDNLVFNLKSEFSEEKIQILNDIFVKENSKNLSITLKEQIITKLHEVILEKDFECVLQMFENRILSLPDNFNADLIDKIVLYLYFRKVEKVHIDSIFDLLELSIFFKLTGLSDMIVNFVSTTLNSEKIVFHIGDLACKSARWNGSNKWIVDILMACKLHLLKNDLLNAYLLFLQQTFFFENEIQSSAFDSIFTSNLELINASLVSEDYKLKLAIFFKMNMLETLKKFCPDLDFRYYIMMNFEKQIDVKKLNVKNLEEFFDKLEINDESFKNRILLSLVEFLEKENLNLKNQLKAQSSQSLFNQNNSNLIFSKILTPSLSKETKEISFGCFPKAVIEAKQSIFSKSDRIDGLFGKK